MSEPAPQQPPPQPHVDRREMMRAVAGGNVMISFLAIVLSLVIGGVLIAFADEDVRAASSYFFARPADMLSQALESVRAAYSALLRGSVINWRADDFAGAIRPLTNSLVFATPLILAGLGIAVAFRAGLFNIGAQGQIIVGAIVAAYLGFAFDLPPGLHLLVAVLGGAMGGAIWGAVPGVLKARFGANEVIVTIMLNYIAIFLISYILKQPSFNPGRSGQRSPAVAEDATYPQLIPDWLFGSSFRLHWGFVVALLAVAFVWWLLERSTVGFELRAVGANPHAARTAGMSVGTVTVITMVIAGGLSGLAATAQVNGTEGSLTAGVAASYGFDAITVALLGRSRPVGTLVAGLLFGALKAGGFLMQAETQTPIDIILVVQSVIVLLIAAPPLIRAIFRLPDPDRPRRRAPAPSAEKVSA
ncbi:MAG: ABC transporter permease [Ornithinimicrobium sp.]